MTATIVIRDYEFADWFMPSDPRRSVPVAAFGQLPPTYQTACIAVGRPERQGRGRPDLRLPRPGRRRRLRGARGRRCRLACRQGDDLRRRASGHPPRGHQRRLRPVFERVVGGVHPPRQEHRPGLGRRTAARLLRLGAHPRARRAHPGKAGPDAQRRAGGGPPGLREGVGGAHARRGSGDVPAGLPLPRCQGPSRPRIRGVRRRSRAPPTPPRS